MEEWGTIITSITTILPFPTNQRSQAPLLLTGSDIRRPRFRPSAVVPRSFVVRRALLRHDHLHGFAAMNFGFRVTTNPQQLSVRSYTWHRPEMVFFAVFLLQIAATSIAAYTYCTASCSSAQVWSVFSGSWKPTKASEPWTVQGATRFDGLLTLYTLNPKP